METTLAIILLSTNIFTDILYIQGVGTHTEYERIIIFFLQEKAMKDHEDEARVRPGDRGNWRRRRNAGRSAHMEMDVLDARFTSRVMVFSSPEPKALR